MSQLNIAKKIKANIVDIQRAYTRRPSFIQYLPWQDFNTEHNLVLLEDNISVGACFRIEPIPCEAKSEETLILIRNSISECLKNAIPRAKNNPWILQVYVYKDYDLNHTYKEIEQYIPQKRFEEPLVQAYLQTMREHLDYVSQPNGIFYDQQVTSTNFRGSKLKVFAMLYQRLPAKQKRTSREQAVALCNQVSRKFSDQLNICGVKVKQLQQHELYHFLFNWFNPGQKVVERDFEQKPVGYDFAEQLFLNIPESFEEGWLFDNKPHKFISIQSLTSLPKVGHLTGERKRKTDDKIFSLIDHMPEGSIFNINVTFQSHTVTYSH